MNWKCLRCTEGVFLEIPLSLVSRCLNAKSLEMFSQGGGMGDSALCLTHGLAGKNAQGDCLFPWEAYYPDIYHILINKNSTLLILLFHNLNFFLSCKWRHTCEYKHHYAPVEINMSFYVHPLLKTYHTEGIKLSLRNTCCNFLLEKEKTSYHSKGSFKKIYLGSKMQRHVVKRD